jgi:hypothetical protein
VAQEAATETPAADAVPTEAAAENPEAPAELPAPETSSTETPPPEANDVEDKK